MSLLSLCAKFYQELTKDASTILPNKRKHHHLDGLPADPPGVLSTVKFDWLEGFDKSRVYVALQLALVNAFVWFSNEYGFQPRTVAAVLTSRILQLPLRLLPDYLTIGHFMDVVTDYCDCLCRDNYKEVVEFVTRRVELYRQHVEFDTSSRTEGGNMVTNDSKTKQNYRAKLIGVVKSLESRVLGGGDDEVHENVASLRRMLGECVPMHFSGVCNKTRGRASYRNPVTQSRAVWGYLDSWETQVEGQPQPPPYEVYTAYNRLLETLHGALGAREGVGAATETRQKVGRGSIATASTGRSSSGSSNGSNSSSSSSGSNGSTSSANNRSPSSSMSSGASGVLESLQADISRLLEFYQQPPRRPSNRAVAEALLRNRGGSVAYFRQNVAEPWFIKHFLFMCLVGLQSITISSKKNEQSELQQLKLDEKKSNALLSGIQAGLACLADRLPGCSEELTNLLDSELLWIKWKQENCPEAITSLPANSVSYEFTSQVLKSDAAAATSSHSAATASSTAAGTTASTVATAVCTTNATGGSAASPSGISTSAASGDTTKPAVTLPAGRPPLNTKRRRRALETYLTYLDSWNADTGPGATRKDSQTPPDLTRQTREWQLQDSNSKDLDQLSLAAKLRMKLTDYRLKIDTDQRPENGVELEYRSIYEALFRWRLARLFVYDYLFTYETFNNQNICSGKATYLVEAMAKTDNPAEPSTASERVGGNGGGDECSERGSGAVSKVGDRGGGSGDDSCSEVSNESSKDGGNGGANKRTSEGKNGGETRNNSSDGLGK